MSELEVVQARTGVPVLKFQGRLLSSSYDPVKEADEWVSQNWDEFKKFECVCLVGSGSGYHAAQLNRRLPDKKIYVIELIPEIYNFINGNFSFSSRLKLIKGSPFLEENREVAEEILSKIFLVKLHPTCDITEPKAYREIYETFLSREPGCLENLGRYCFIADALEMQKSDKDMPLTIKNIHIKTGIEREAELRMQAMLLRELVK